MGGGSFRYLQFGVQLLEKGAIYDFESANPLWKEVRCCPRASIQPSL